jgi:hypothetical protein
VRAANATQHPKFCFAFQKGKCVRPDCPFLHEKSPDPKPQEGKGGKPKARVAQATVSKKSSLKKKHPPRKGSKSPGRGAKRKDSGKEKCYRCGGGHLAPECKFEGECDYCHKAWHKQIVCKKKVSDDTRAHVAFASPPDEVSIRIACVSEVTTQVVTSTVEVTTPPAEPSGESSREVDPPIIVRMLKVKREQFEVKSHSPPNQEVPDNRLWSFPDGDFYRAGPADFDREPSTYNPFTPLQRELFPPPVDGITPPHRPRGRTYPVAQPNLDYYDKEEGEVTEDSSYEDYFYDPPPGGSPNHCDTFSRQSPAGLCPRWPLSTQTQGHDAPH